MRVVLVLGAVLFDGEIVVACAFRAGADGAGPVAFVVAGLAIAYGLPVDIGRLANWGVPGDEPAFGWRSKR